MNDELYKERQSVVPKAWPECYYDVEDAAVRYQMLAKYGKDQMMSDSLRRKLFEQRYERRDSQYVDTYVTAIMRLRMMSLESVGFFNRKKIEKQIADSCRTLCQGQTVNEESEEKEVYFCELKHAVKVFIGLCRRDKQYCSVLLGQGRKKESAVVSKLIQDFENMTLGLERKLNLKDICLEQMKYLKRVMAEAFHEEYPREETFYRYLLRADSIK